MRPASTAPAHVDQDGSGRSRHEKRSQYQPEGQQSTIGHGVLGGSASDSVSPSWCWFGVRTQ